MRTTSTMTVGTSMAKNFASVMVTIAVACLTMMVLGVPTAEAATRTQDQAVSWARSQVGKSIDYDKAYGAQCVDLTKAYYSYLGVSAVRGNGIDYSWNSLPSGWKRVKGGTPQKGDILVFGGGGGYGHVAIFVSNSEVIDQNLNNNHKVCKWGSKYNSGKYGPYWGYIRPNWAAPVKVTTKGAATGSAAASATKKSTSATQKATTASKKISISGQTIPGNTLKKGKCFGLRGKVTSGVKITSMTGTIYNSKGKAVYSRTVKPNSTTCYVQNNYSGGNINNSLLFNRLAKGKYTYKLTATNSGGTTTLVNKTFTIS